VTDRTGTIRDRTTLSNLQTLAHSPSTVVGWMVAFAGMAAVTCVARRPHDREALSCRVADRPGVLGRG
jgi:hypothetical protein